MVNDNSYKSKLLDSGIPLEDIQYLEELYVKNLKKHAHMNGYYDLTNEEVEESKKKLFNDVIISSGKSIDSEDVESVFYNVFEEFRGSYCTETSSNIVISVSKAKMDSEGDLFDGLIESYYNMS